MIGKVDSALKLRPTSDRRMNVVTKMTDKTGLLRWIPLILPNLILQEDYFFILYKMKTFSLGFFYWIA